jgi:hypothetical protein
MYLDTQSTKVNNCGSHRSSVGFVRMTVRMLTGMGGGFGGSTAPRGSRAHVI